MERLTTPFDIHATLEDILSEFILQYILKTYFYKAYIFTLQKFNRHRTAKYNRQSQSEQFRYLKKSLKIGRVLMPTSNRTGASV